jgi:hypothetical protein
MAEEDYKDEEFEEDLTVAEAMTLAQEELYKHGQSHTRKHREEDIESQYIDEQDLEATLAQANWNNVLEPAERIRFREVAEKEQEDANSRALSQTVGLPQRGANGRNIRKSKQTFKQREYTHRTTMNEHRQEPFLQWEDPYNSSLTFTPRPVPLKPPLFDRARRANMDGPRDAVEVEAPGYLNKKPQLWGNPPPIMHGPSSSPPPLPLPRPSGFPSACLSKLALLFPPLTSLLVSVPADELPYLQARAIYC